jgi:hypothetical protein
MPVMAHNVAVNRNPSKTAYTKGKSIEGNTSAELSTEAMAVPIASVAINERSIPLEITTTAIAMLRMPKIETLLIKVKRFPVEKNLSKNIEKPANIKIVTIKIINS